MDLRHKHEALSVGVGLLLLILTTIAALIGTPNAGFPFEVYGTYYSGNPIQTISSPNITNMILNFAFYYLAAFRALKWIEEDE